MERWSRYRRILETYWPASLAEAVSSGSKRDPVSKDKVERK